MTAVKLYPAGATTNSDSGVTDVSKSYAALEAMEAGMCRTGSLMAPCPDAERGGHVVAGSRTASVAGVSDATAGGGAAGCGAAGAG